jgi:benzoylformate decarboxylase
VVQIGNRDWELAKNYPAEIALKADVKETLRALLPVLRSKMTAEQKAQAARRLSELAASNWTAQRARAQQDALKASAARPMDPRLLMLRITEALPRDAVVVDEGLTASISFLSHFAVRDAHCYYGLASGAIGFAMAGAVGVSLALPDRPVMAMVGDGSAMYSIQALWTAAHLKLPISYVIANNRSYRILKERLVSMRKSERFVGMDLRDPDIDFVSLARSMGVAARRVTDPQDVAPALREATRAGGPQLVEVRVADGFGG